MLLRKWKRNLSNYWFKKTVFFLSFTNSGQISVCTGYANNGTFHARNSIILKQDCGRKEKALVSNTDEFPSAKQQMNIEMKWRLYWNQENQRNCLWWRKSFTIGTRYCRFNCSVWLGLGFFSSRLEHKVGFKSRFWLHCHFSFFDLDTNYIQAKSKKLKITKCNVGRTWKWQYFEIKYFLYCMVQIKSSVGYKDKFSTNCTF